MTNQNYEILRQIGEGGMGRVMLAKGKRTGNYYALKEAQIYEGKLLSFLHHPAVPVYIDEYRDDERNIVVMEYIKGKTIQDLIKIHGRLSASCVTQIGIQLCEILEYLHSQNVLFLDLKPENIMITKEKKIYLIDYGIASCYYYGVNDKPLGTKYYAAPEQYEGIVGMHTDIYALGKTLYVMLTGELEQQQKKQPYQGCTHTLMKLLDCCCNRQINKRPKSVHSVLLDLRKMKVGRPIKIVTKQDIWLSGYSKEAF